MPTEFVAQNGAEDQRVHEDQRHRVCEVEEGEAREEGRQA